MEENRKVLVFRRRLAKKAPDLPGDIIIDILSRLPVKSLMRFRCVCKSWHALFTDPNFIDIHLNQTSRNNNGYVLLHHGFVITDEYDVSLHFDETFVEHTRLRFPFKEPLQSFIVVGCCNGLLCLALYPSRFTYLWNPATRKFKAFPNPLLLGDDFKAVFITFGFVPLLNDYKVVMFLYRAYDDKFIKNGRLHLQVPPVVEIYSLSTNSWRRVQNVVPFIPQHASKDPIVKGVAHWVAHMEMEENGVHEFILSFDMATEVFGEIKLPECCCGDYIDKTVIMLMESLSLFVGIWGGHVDIWVMKQYGAAESWTKHFTFDQSINFYSPLGFKKNGEVVLELENENELVSYDPRVNQVKSLHIHGVSFPRSLDVVTHYMESLVLLNDGN